MSLKSFAKHKIDKTSLSKINGGGYGTVRCKNGETFSANAASEDSVEQGGARWCRDRGGVEWSLYIGDLQ